MKKIFLFLGLALALSSQIKADNITLSTATVNPGGNEVEVTVSLNGTRLYCGYNLDITLPEGLVMNYYEGELDVTIATDQGLYPSSEGRNKTYTHGISCSYGEVGKQILRVACISNKNESFTSTSGVLFTMYLKATSYAKPGTPEIRITGTDFGIYDASAKTTTAYHFDDATSNAITIASNATAPVSVNATYKMSTCILPFAVATLPSGLTAYSVSSVQTEGENGYLVLNKETSMAAYTPYLLYAPSGCTENLSGTVVAANYPTEGYVKSGCLCGAITTQQKSEGYVLQNLSDGFAFYNMGGQTFSIPAGKCWLEMPSGQNNIKRFGWITDNTTGITSAKLDTQDGNIYTVDGIMVTKMVPGKMYIKNGKKILCIK